MGVLVMAGCFGVAFFEVLLMVCTGERSVGGRSHASQKPKKKKQK
jgi:hypothetical protein